MGFYEAKPIRDKKKIIRNLVDLAKKIENCGTGEVRKDLYKTISELCLVYLNTEEYEDARWRVIQAYNVRKMPRSRLVEIVRDKEARAIKYKKCDVYWLLVVIDFINPAQDQEIEFDDSGKIQTETFEKVIVYKTLFGHVLEAK